jgi:mono/diheme cytochrome c family protein
VPGSAAHGEWVYRLQCASCHTLNGYRSLVQRTAQWTPVFGYRFLEHLDQQGVMPPFQGDARDRAALTAFLLSTHGKPVTAADVDSALAREVKR